MTLMNLSLRTTCHSLERIREPDSMFTSNIFRTECCDFVLFWKLGIGGFEGFNSKGCCRWMGREALDDVWVKSLPVTYALFSGTIGTQSVLFCKTLSTLLRTTLAGDSQLRSYFFWLTFLSFLATACFWISRLNQVSLLSFQIICSNLIVS